MADKRPTCKLCHKPHWLREPHVYADVQVESCTTCELLEAEVKNLKRELAKSNEKVRELSLQVTLNATPVTIIPLVTETPSVIVMGKVGRPITGLAQSNAARQKAYRERHSL